MIARRFHKSVKITDIRINDYRLKVSTMAGGSIKRGDTVYFSSLHRPETYLPRFS